MGCCCYDAVDCCCCDAVAAVLLCDTVGCCIAAAVGCADLDVTGHTASELRKAEDQLRAADGELQAARDSTRQLAYLVAELEVTRTQLEHQEIATARWMRAAAGLARQKHKLRTVHWTGLALIRHRLKAATTRCLGFESSEPLAHLGTIERQCLQLPVVAKEKDGLNSLVSRLAQDARVQVAAGIAAHLHTRRSFCVLLLLQAQSWKGEKWGSLYLTLHRWFAVSDCLSV